MARTQQDILVKIKVLLEGLGNVRALSGHIKELNGGSGQTAALAGNIDRLAGAVDRLATASAKTSKTGGGFIRFLVGVSAVVSTLANIPQAFQGIGKLLDLADGLGESLGGAFGKVKAAGASLFSSISQGAAGAAARAGAAFSGLGAAAGGLGAALGAALPVVLAIGASLGVALAAVTPLAVAFTGLAAAVAVGVAALFKVGPAGLELNSQLEQVKLGVAAVISSLGQLKVDGQPVEGAEKLAAAFTLADEQVRKLRVDAINTTATFEQILPAFQEALAPGLAAGLSLDEVRNVTVQVVQAAGALNIPLHQVNQEVRSILEGNIDLNARLAKALDISAEDIKLWKQKGTLAEELNKKLAGFAVAGVEAAQTVEGLKSNLQEALNVFNQEATTRAFAALKGQIQRLLPQLFDFKNSGIHAQFKTLAQLADDVLVRVVRIGGSIAQGIVTWLKKAADFVDRNKATINDIVNLVEMVVRQLIQAGGVLVRVGTDTATWKSLLDTVKGVLGLINVLLAVMVNELKRAEPLLRLAALAGAALLAANPTFAALARVPTGDGRTEIERARGALDEGKAKLSPEELRRRGFKPDITVDALPKLPGTKKGGQKPDLLRQLTEAAEDAALGTDRARVERAYNLTKDFLERQSKLIEDKLADRAITIERYYSDEERFQREAIDAEIAKLNELYRLREVDLKRQKERIDSDPDKDLTAADRVKKKLAAEEEFRQAVIPIVERLTMLDRERLDLADQIGRNRRDELKAFQQMLDEVDEQLALETGDTLGAIEAARRSIDAANKERLEKIAREKGATSTEYQQAMQLVEVLKKKAEYQLLYNELRQQQDALDFAEDRIRRDVENGLISEKVGREQIIEAQLKHRDAVKETVDKMGELAAASGDTALIIDAEQAAAGLEQLGQQVDETARRINDSLKTGLIDSLTDIITRTKTVGEAFRALAQSILAEIARILATNFVTKLLGNFLTTKSSGGGLGDSLGSIVSGILSGGFAQGGMQPATPGGRIIRVAEGGFDEVVLTTDPKHRGRTSRLLGQFLRRTGLAPDFGAAVLEGAVGGVPSFAAGGFALSDIEPPEQLGGDTINLNVNAPIQTKDLASFKQSEQVVNRTVARAAQDGIRRAKTRPRQ